MCAIFQQLWHTTMMLMMVCRLRVGEGAVWDGGLGWDNGIADVLTV